VLRRVGDREAGSLRQDLDTPLALGQLLQEFEPIARAPAIWRRPRTGRTAPRDRGFARLWKSCCIAAMQLL
jgi:hypothetical protein